MSLGSVQIYSGLGSGTVEDFSGAWYTSFVTSLLSDFEKFQQDVIDNVAYGVDLSNYALTTYVDGEIGGLHTSLTGSVTNLETTLTASVTNLGTTLTAYIDQSVSDIDSSQDLTALTGRITALETEIDGGLFS